MTAQTETAGGFATAAKSAAGYLDQAANSHGAEKIGMTLRALQTKTGAAHLVEIGPGGGAALNHLTETLTATADRRGTLDVTLIEAPGIVSQTLAEAVENYNASKLGTCTLITGFAQELDSILGRAVDVVAASALMHEVYSYGNGYRGIHEMMRTLPIVLKPGGHFAYRDVYTVDAPTLHETVTQTYTDGVWLQFIRMFVPQYLSDGRHPYHHSADDPTVRQNSRTVALEKIDPKTSAIITGPIGLFREIQRHYITFRDYAWRSGALGFIPDLDGRFSADWIDADAGHKRVHFTLTESLSPRQRALMTTVSERFEDHYVMDGDRFDEWTDAALVDLLTSAENGDERCGTVWGEWIEREGHETYGYLTPGELLAKFAISSAEAKTGTVMMPRTLRDVVTAERAYYTRYLRRLPNPLPDGKLLVLFTNIPVTDTDALTTGLATLAHLCSREDMTRLNSALAQM
ncbi:class I SAM-dependent methyltransferase [Streptomyces erythrochromogenes]|uniref:hypothetical protein n=1 Tax=Streptomyces erythrochromogenes TaxID=285574 RepID=UPI0036975791